MANTEVATGSILAIKRWCDQLTRETFGKMSITSLIGSGPTSCIQLLTDLDKNPGDNMVFDMMPQDRSDGVNGDSRLKGFETPLSFFQDDLKINQKRHGHSFTGMSQQRTLHDLNAVAKSSLSEWWSWFIEASLFAHMAGVSGVGEETVLGALGADTAGTDFAGNAINALDAGHLVDNNASAFSLAQIDKAVAKAKVNNPRVAPIMIDGRECYVAYLHPYQVKAMKLEASSSATVLGWSTAQQFAGARGESNPIFTGALGVYNNVILRESEFIPTSVSTVRHGLMLGQGAGVIALGNAWKKQSRVSSGGGGAFFSYATEDDDYGNVTGIAAGSILGLSRPMFNSKAFGVIGLRSTDAAP